MKLLAKLLDSLSPYAMRKIHSLPVRGKQKAILDLALNHRHSPEVIKEELARLGMSKEHYYEINSVLLRLSLEALSSEGKAELLELLAGKNQKILFNRELRRIESLLEKTIGKEAADFYYQVYESLHNFAFNLVNWDAIEEYGKKYLNALPNRTNEDDMAISVRHIMNSMIRLQAEDPGNMETMERLFAELNKIAEQSRSSFHPLLRYNIHCTYSWYALFVTQDAKQNLEHLLSSVQFAEQLTMHSREEKLSFSKLRIAEAYSSLGNIDEALKRFEDVYNDLKPNDTLWKRYYFLLCYCELLIYDARYDKAEALLKKHFEPLFSSEPNTFSVTAAGSYTLLYLLSGDLRRAKKYLNLTMQLNSKNNFTLLTEVSNRFLEAAYYYLAGEWDYAYSVCIRSLHYLRMNGLSLGDSDFGYKFKIIEAPTIFYQEGIPFPKELELEYAKLSRPIEGLYGKLAIKIRQTNAMKRL